VTPEVEPLFVIDGLLQIQSQPRLRGDENFDHRLDISDGIAVLKDFFLGESAGVCWPAVDVNADERIKVTDAASRSWRGQEPWRSLP
jgi:hypothetical protein